MGLNISAALAGLNEETDPTLRHLQLASLVCALFRELQAPHGLLRVISPEDLLVERILIAHYPQPYEPAAACARKLMAVALAGQVDLDWDEVQGPAERPEYRIVPELRTMVSEVAHELGRSDPYHS